MHPCTAANLPVMLMLSNTNKTVLKVAYHAPLAHRIIEGWHMIGGLVLRESDADAVLSTATALPYGIATELGRLMKCVSAAFAAYSPVAKKRTAAYVEFEATSIDEAARVIATADCALSNLWDAIFNKYYTEIKIACAENFQLIVGDFRSAKRARWNNENLSSVALDFPIDTLDNAILAIDTHDKPAALLVCSAFQAHDILTSVGEQVIERNSVVTTLLASMGRSRVTALPVARIESITAAQLMGHSISHILVTSRQQLLKEGTLHAVDNICK